MKKPSILRPPLQRCSPTMSYHHPTKHGSTLDFKQRPSKYSSSDLQHKNQILNFKFTSCSAIYILVMVVGLMHFATPTNASRPISHLMQFTEREDRRDGFAISPKNCQVASEKGTCMFVWECLKTEGKHLGMCMDGFMFGSCCVHDDNNNQLTDLNDLSHNNDDFGHDEIASQNAILNQNAISEPIKDKLDVVQIEEDIIDEIKLNVDNDEIFKKYKLTTTTPASETTTSKDDKWSAYPTRPSRPTKPTMRWPTFHSTSTHSDVTPSIYDVTPLLFDDEIKTTTASTTMSERHSYVHFPQAVTRPTKQPPPLETTITKTTTPRPVWSWEDRRSTKTTPLPDIQITTTTTTTTERPTTTAMNKMYFPSSSSSESNNAISGDITQWTKKGRPTRPTRPPKPSGFDLVNYFPQDQALEEIAVAVRTPPSTTSSTTTTTTSVTTTTTTTTTSSATTAMLRLPTPRPPVHLMPPPRLSTTSLTTPGPLTTSVSGAQPRGGCGVPVLNKSCPKGRIVNGTQSCYGQFPWQVSVRRTSFFGFSSTHRCGGALINELWVATAGHCVDDLLIPKIRIRVGEWDFSSTSEPQGSVELKVVEKIVHPKYNFFTYEYDLALVKLERRIDFQENIIPICLPGNEDLLVGEVGVVAGWGRLSEGGKLPNILQYVSVPIVSNAQCKEMFLRAGRHEVIPEIFMCAGYDGGGRDSCQGDSGGPLVVKGNDGRYFLGGIISWGIGCAEPNLPGVCTRISKFTEWILDHVT